MAEDQNNNYTMHSKIKTFVIVLSIFALLIAVLLFNFFTTDQHVWHTISIVNKKDKDDFRETSPFQTFHFANIQKENRYQIRVVLSEPLTACESLRKTLKPETYSLNEGENAADPNGIVWVLLAKNSSCDVQTKISKAEDARFNHLLVYGDTLNASYQYAFNKTNRDLFNIDVSFISEDDATILQEKYPKTLYTLWLDRKLSYAEASYKIYVAVFTYIENLQTLFRSIYDYIISSTISLPQRIFSSLKVETQVLAVVSLLILFLVGYVVINEDKRRVKREQYEQLEREKMRKWLEDERKRAEDARRRKEEAENLKRAKHDDDERECSGILGIPPCSPADVVKAAYKRLCLIWHPDKVPADSKEECTEKFKEIRRAHTTLMEFREEEEKVEKERKRKYEEARRRKAEEEEKERQRQEKDNSRRGNKKAEEKFSIILQIPPNSSVVAIRERFKELRKSWHPDKAPEESKKEFTTKFQEIHNAYTELLKCRGES